ncbi:MAG: hypothetical protein IPK19_14545 [Chloroflexi bacterium]|nr:hypothetical protein [Chloroflexota bacterium]
MLISLDGQTRDMGQAEYPPHGPLVVRGVDAELFPTILSDHTILGEVALTGFKLEQSRKNPRQNASTGKVSVAAGLAGREPEQREKPAVH